MAIAIVADYCQLRCNDAGAPGFGPAARAGAAQAPALRGSGAPPFCESVTVLNENGGPGGRYAEIGTRLYVAPAPRKCFKSKKFHPAQSAGRPLITGSAAHFDQALAENSSVRADAPKCVAANCHGRGYDITMRPFGEHDESRQLQAEFSIAAIACVDASPPDRGANRAVSVGDHRPSSTMWLKRTCWRSIRAGTT